MAPLELANQRFGRLMALYVVPRISRRGGRRWKCRCDCGNENVVNATDLRHGVIRSCGCSHQKADRARRRAYNAWRNMIERCTNPTNMSWSSHGGRGIGVCDAWLKGFESFLSDMGKPDDGQSLDRIDNNGNYSRQNCRWTDAKTQSRNTRSNRWVEFRGERKSLAEWAEVVGLDYRTVRSRIQRGWSTDESLCTPVGAPRCADRFCARHGLVVGATS